MSQPHATRPRLAPRSVAALVLTLCAALLLAAAAPASAVTRKKATNKALSALGSKKGNKAVIVFGLKKPLRAGTRVTTTKPSRLVIKVGRERAFFYYEDLKPFKPYPHAGRVALVGARSGKVRLSKRITRRPLVNGTVPVFLKSAKQYRSPEFRVFAKASDPAPPAAPEAAAAAGNKNPKADKQDVTVKKNKPKHITLTASDEDGEMLMFEITKQPDHGTLSGQLPYPIYTPDTNYLGKDKFAFKARDDQHDSNTAHVSIDVVPLGTPPTVTTSSGCTAYTEQTPAVTVDNVLNVSDPDDTKLDSASVRISANFQESDDLLFTDQNGISGSYDDSTGVLTLTGDASVANYQTALRSVRYRNLASSIPSATKGIEFTANDAGSDSAPATKQICIAEGGGTDNNRPVGGTSEGALLYTENDGPVPIDSEFFLSDPDSSNLTGATVKFTTSQPSEEDEIFQGGPGTAVFNFFPAEDDLAFTDQNGITGSYNDTNGVLTLTGTASVANYQAALRSVTYENSSENPSAEPRTTRFQVTDSTGALSVANTRGIYVTPVNDAPVVTPTDGVASYTEGDPATTVDSGLTVGDVDDTDIEGGQVKISSGFEAGDDLIYVNQLGIAGVYNTGTGVLTLTGTASTADYQTALRSIHFRGTSDNPPASKTVEFVVNDGDLDSATATRDIAVTGVNDKPVLDTTDTALSYTEGDGQVAVDPAIAATDVDSATFAGATVQITGGFNSSDDSLWSTDVPGITGVYDSQTGTLTLSGTASVADYQTALGSVTYENSSDNPSTTRTISFQVDDGAANDNLSDPVTRDIDITPVNDAPVVTTSDSSTEYTVGGTGIAVDSALTLTDADDVSIESAQVRISSGFESGDDLVYVDQPPIAGVYNTGTGVLTLTGTATVADYETALRSIQYRHTGDNPSASRTVEFTVNDGDASSNAASKSIDVVTPPTGEAPVVTTSADSSSYTLGDSAGSTVDGALTVTDADDTNIESAHVQIEGYEPGDDLVYVSQLGITGTFDSETGVLPLTGTASLADYETALRSIKFRHFGDNQSALRSVAFRVNDGDFDSAFSLKPIDLITPPPSD